MGNDSLVLWLSAELALAYFVAVIVGMLGMLQVIAAHWQRESLCWLPVRMAKPLGSLAMLGALAWFYLSYYPLIFVPGPAGLELMLLFGGGTAIAVWLTRGLRWLVTRIAFIIGWQTQIEN
ncbi:MAG: hypothetical protein H0T73_13065 [Ardenticatenales bacterium]|nr:hypothetical protein [Ardenticatenales bacterium]